MLETQMILERALESFIANPAITAVEAIDMVGNEMGYVPGVLYPALHAAYESLDDAIIVTPLDSTEENYYVDLVYDPDEESTVGGVQVLGSGKNGWSRDATTSAFRMAIRNAGETSRYVPWQSRRVDDQDWWEDIRATHQAEGCQILLGVDQGFDIYPATPR